MMNSSTQKNNTITNKFDSKAESKKEALNSITREYSLDEVKQASSKIYYDQVNVRLPAELNDWLNSIVRQTKRLHGSKIPKEIIIETALLFLKESDINWNEVRTQDDLIDRLKHT